MSKPKPNGFADAYNTLMGLTRKPPRGRLPVFDDDDHFAWYCPAHAKVLYNEGDLDTHQGSVDTDADDRNIRRVFVDIDTGDVFGLLDTMGGTERANPRDYIGHIMHWQEAYLPFKATRGFSFD